MVCMFWMCIAFIVPKFNNHLQVHESFLESQGCQDNRSQVFLLLPCLKSALWMWCLWSARHTYECGPRLCACLLCLFFAVPSVQMYLLFDCVMQLNVLFFQKHKPIECLEHISPMHRRMFIRGHQVPGKCFVSSCGWGVCCRPIHKRALLWKLLGHVVDYLFVGAHIMRKFIAAIGELSSTATYTFKMKFPIP